MSGWNIALICTCYTILMAPHRLQAQNPLAGASSPAASPLMLFLQNAPLEGPYHDYIHITSTTSESPVFHVLIKSRTFPGPNRLGLPITVRSVAGEIITATVSLNDLPILLRSGWVEMVAPAHRLFLENDSARRVARIGRIQQAQKSLPPGIAPYRGRGVIIGIVDTGIDWQHGDFIDDRTGESRILFLWDQSLKPVDGEHVPVPYGYGVEYHQETITRRIRGWPGAPVRSRDVNGHGTHVAGIAAGDGSETAAPDRFPPGTYAGMAPEASLIVVKVPERIYEDHVLDAIHYIFQRADELQMPAVINLSLGSHFGAHDGSALLERAIDALSGPGRIVVKSAGNDAAHPQRPRLIHAEGTVAVGDTAVVEIEVSGYRPRPGPRNDLMRVEMWYQGGDRLTVTVVRPDGSRVQARHRQMATHQANGGFVTILNAEAGPYPINGDNRCTIDVYDAFADTPPAPGTWQILVTASEIKESGHFDMWLASVSLGGMRENASFSRGGENDELVTLPGTAERVITVGAFSSRTRFQSADGNVYLLPDARRGELAYFSSFGTREDVVAGLFPRQKPEICAAGFGVVSALSYDSPLRQTMWMAADRKHVLMAGTSMSAPQVTGIVALLLQQNPHYTPEDIRRWLTVSARADRITGSVPNRRWGYGKVDAFAALGGNRRPAPVMDVSFTPSGRGLTWRFPGVDEEGLPETVREFEIYRTYQSEKNASGARGILLKTQWPGVLLPSMSERSAWSMPEFWQVVAVDEFGNRSRPSQIVGKAAFSLRSDTGDGGQLIPWWFDQPEFRTASQWLRVNPAVAAIARWDVSEQRWQVVPRGDSAADFQLQAGEVYRVHALRDTTILLYGRLPVGLQYRLKPAVHKNNNLIWIPFDKTELHRASDLARDIGPAVELISVWNTGSRSWRSYLPALDFTDFQIHPGMAVMVAVKAPVVWPWRPPVISQPSPLWKRMR